MNDSNNISYQSLAEPSEGFFKDRGSKFYGFAFPVDSEASVSNEMKILKDRFPDATHHCFAYRLGPEGLKYRYSDDGEPSNSAGSPIYRVILSAELTDVLIVVVRYYGGKKLGVAGLIEAYGGAAADSIAKGEIILKTLMKSVTVRTPFNKEYLIYQFAAKHKMGQPLVDDRDSNVFHFEVELDRWSDITQVLQSSKHFELIMP